MLAAGASLAGCAAVLFLRMTDPSEHASGIVVVPEELVRPEAIELEKLTADIVAISVPLTSNNVAHASRAAATSALDGRRLLVDGEWAALPRNGIKPASLMSRILEGGLSSIDLIYRNTHMNPNDAYIDGPRRTVLRRYVEQYRAKGQDLRKLYSQASRKEVQYLLLTNQVLPLKPCPLGAKEASSVRKTYLPALESEITRLGPDSAQGTILRQRLEKIRQDVNGAAEFMIAGVRSDCLVMHVGERYRIPKTMLPMSHRILETLNFIGFECCGQLTNWLSREGIVTDEQATAILSGYRP